MKGKGMKKMGKKNKPYINNSSKCLVGETK
jgi:hypothetical protein